MHRTNAYARADRIRMAGSGPAGPRRSTYTHRAVTEVPLAEPMPVTEVEMSGLRRGIMWGLAVSCPFWAIALGALIVAVSQ